MKRLKLFFLGVGLVLLPWAGHGQTPEKDLSPYYVKVQFAGDIGLVSVGIGRHSFNRKLETDLSFGYLPKKIGGDHLLTVAMKSMLLPTRPIRIEKVKMRGKGFIIGSGENQKAGAS